MRWSDATARPTDRKLREFALIGANVLAMLALGRLLTPGGTWMISGNVAAAATVAAIGIARPRWLAPLFTLWMIVAFPIGWLVSHMVLGIIYFGLITPLGLAFRLAGRDALDRAWPGRQDSYWREKPAADKPERYLQQF